MLKNLLANIGINVKETSKAATFENIIEYDRSLNISLAIPGINSIGINTTIVVNADAITESVTSVAHHPTKRPIAALLSSIVLPSADFSTATTIDSFPDKNPLSVKSSVVKTISATSFNFSVLPLL